MTLRLHMSSVNLQDLDEDEEELNSEALKYIGLGTPAKKRKRRCSGKENVEPGSSMGSDIANSSFGSVVSDSLELIATLRALSNAIKELNGEIRNMRQTDETLAKEIKNIRESVFTPSRPAKMTPEKQVLFDGFNVMTLYGETHAKFGLQLARKICGEDALVTHMMEPTGGAGRRSLDQSKVAIIKGKDPVCFDKFLTKLNCSLCRITHLTF